MKTKSTTNPYAVRYSSRGFRSVLAESMKEAAFIFARRLARKEFGKRGDVRTCELGSWAHCLGEFSAFIGITKGAETTGHNVNFTVRLEA